MNQLIKKSAILAPMIKSNKPMILDESFTSSGKVIKVRSGRIFSNVTLSKLRSYTFV